MRYLGIDYGTKKTGLALSDEAGTMGFPREVVPTDDMLLDRVLAFIQEQHVGAVVMGESRTLSGEENPVAAAARDFANHITEHAVIPVYFESEVFTTQEARRLPTGERDTARDPVDAKAAALILTSYLSRHGNN